MKIKCVIVDDEPLAQKGLEEFVREIDFLELIAVCDNALQVYSLLRENKVDLILLDIEMPGLSGIDFIRSLKNRPAIIFTTAYPEYALQGYDLDVIDYLVKPILFQRFVQAINKAKHFLADKLIDHSDINVDSDYFFIKVNYQFEKIFYKDVLFIEALQNYVAVHLDRKKLISYITMSGMEKKLPAHLFMRIHKSYIVALDKIEMINGYKVIIQSNELPVSRNIKEQLMKKVEGKLVKR